MQSVAGDLHRRLEVGGSFGSISLKFPIKVAVSHAHRSWWLALVTSQN